MMTLSSFAAPKFASSEMNLRLKDGALEQMQQAKFDFDQKIKELPLHLVKWWLCNEIEGSEITGEKDTEAILNSMASTYPNSNILLTVGEKGSLYKSSNECIHQPIYKVNAVDTTAAGDTFTGFFLGSLMKGLDTKKALEIAAAASAIAVSRQGASSSIPCIEDVNKFILNK